MLLSSMSAENRTSADFLGVAGPACAHSTAAPKEETMRNFSRERMGSESSIEMLEQSNARSDTAFGTEEFPRHTKTSYWTEGKSERQPGRMLESRSRPGWCEIRQSERPDAAEPNRHHLAMHRTAPRFSGDRGSM